MKILVFFLLVSPTFGSCQSSDVDTFSFSYAGVVAVDSVTAKVLQSRAKLFVAENFRSAKDVIQLDDADAGIVLIKGNLIPIVKVPLMGKTEYGYVHFTAKIQVKDGKYKYTFSDFSHEAYEKHYGTGGDLTRKKPECGTFGMSLGYWRQIKAYTNSDVKSLISSLEKSMRSSEIAKKEDF